MLPLPVPASFDAYGAGLILGLSLIVAIGAQNAFVLRQGLRGEHVLVICATCALSDAVLILAGVGGFAGLIQALPWLDPLLRYGGAAFLFWYALTALGRAWRAGAALVPADDRATPLGPALATCLLLTWANPHVYLDTVVLIGSISTRFAGAKAAFAAGAMSASLLFFFSLGYGARLLRPLFAKPASWRLLDLVIGLTMGAVGWSLIA